MSRPVDRSRTASVRVPFTCGELVQGTDPDGGAFLVSCPIDRYAEVRASLHDTGASNGPPDRPKALAAARRTLAELGGESLGVRLEIRSDLPVGRGFGTSTADVVGAIAATARAFGEDLTPQAIARIAVAVEPSDGTMFPGLAVFDHRTGSRWEALGPAPALAIVVLDFGGAVDTVAHHARRPAVPHAATTMQGGALDLVRRGVRSADPAVIGSGATLSTIANEALLPKRALAETIEFAVRLGAVGVCAAHSGTALGLLLPPEPALAARVAAAARRSLPGLADAWPTRLVGGGVRVGAGDASGPPRAARSMAPTTRR